MNIWTRSSNDVLRIARKLLTPGSELKFPPIQPSRVAWSEEDCTEVAKYLIEKEGVESSVQDLWEGFVTWVCVFHRLIRSTEELMPRIQSPVGPKRSGGSWNRAVDRRRAEIYRRVEELRAQDKKHGLLDEPEVALAERALGKRTRDRDSSPDILGLGRKRIKLESVLTGLGGDSESSEDSEYVHSEVSRS